MLLKKNKFLVGRVGAWMRRRKNVLDIISSLYTYICIFLNKCTYVGRKVRSSFKNLLYFFSTWLKGKEWGKGSMKRLIFFFFVCLRLQILAAKARILGFTWLKLNVDGLCSHRPSSSLSSSSFCTKPASRESQSLQSQTSDASGRRQRKKRTSNRASRDTRQTQKEINKK